MEKRTAESEQSGLRRGRLSAAFDDFAKRGVLAGVLLMVATVVALAWAKVLLDAGDQQAARAVLDRVEPGVLAADDVV